jgi:Trk K+ transport system NAD-binding subunit
VLNGDAADEELLMEENVDDADVFCALTNAEESEHPLGDAGETARRQQGAGR